MTQYLFINFTKCVIVFRCIICMFAIFAILCWIVISTMIQEDGSSHLALIEVHSAHATAPEPYLVSLTAPDSLTAGTPATFTATLANTGLDFSAPVRLTLSCIAPADTTAEAPVITLVTPADVSILSGAADVQAAFSFDVLPPAGLYTATLEHLNGSVWLPLTDAYGTPAALSFCILPAEETDGILSSPFTTSPYKGERGSLTPYDLSGRFVSPINGKRGLLIHNGSKLIAR